MISYGNAEAQNVSDLIISEIMADGDSSVVDDYGNREGWIELFNTSQGTVNYGGCYLSDDRSDLKKSMIPKSDARTKLGPRQVVLFHASGKGSQGTYYAGFKIRRGSTVYLVSNDGRTIVDSLAVPANLPSGKSVVKMAHDIRGMEFVTESTPAEPTPMAVNSAGDEETGSQKMAREDRYGLVLTVVSVGVVFSALIILWWLFSLLGRVSCEKSSKRNEAKGMSPEVAAAIGLGLQKECSDGTYAAIALALAMYNEESVHDKESFVITIKHHASQWNEREQGFRRLPR